MGIRRQYIQDKVYNVLIGFLLCLQAGTSLRCYECSESFNDIWMPLDCQVNASAVSSRECNDKQPFCYVARVAIKGILTQITRDCIDQCFYGCVASDFGITAITCTSCCDDNLCNTGNDASRATVNILILWIVTFFFFLALEIT